jgi:hypothetical protein
MAPTKVGALTPQQRDEVLAAVRDYATRAGFIRAPGGMPEQRNAEPIYIRNTDTQAVPPFGCVQVTGTAAYDGGTVITAARPVDATGAAGKYLFNGPVEIAPNAIGIVFAGPVIRVLTNGAAVSCGAGWSPVIAQWAVAPVSGGLISAIGADVIDINIMRAFYGFTSTCKPPVTDIRISGLNFQLSRDCEANWTTWATGGECP